MNKIRCIYVLVSGHMPSPSSGKKGVSYLGNRDTSWEILWKIWESWRALFAEILCPKLQEVGASLRPRSPEPGTSEFALMLKLQTI